jgi:hypothetical protein
MAKKGKRSKTSTKRKKKTGGGWGVNKKTGKRRDVCIVYQRDAAGKRIKGKGTCAVKTRYPGKTQYKKYKTALKKGKFDPGAEDMRGVENQTLSERLTAFLFGAKEAGGQGFKYPDEMARKASVKKPIEKKQAVKKPAAKKGAAKPKAPSARGNKMDVDSDGLPTADAARDDSILQQYAILGEMLEEPVTDAKLMALPIDERTALAVIAKQIAILRESFDGPEFYIRAVRNKEQFNNVNVEFYTALSDVFEQAAWILDVPLVRPGNLKEDPEGMTVYILALMERFDTRVSKILSEIVRGKVAVDDNSLTILRALLRTIRALNYKVTIKVL